VSGGALFAVALLACALRKRCVVVTKRTQRKHHDIGVAKLDLVVEDWGSSSPTPAFTTSSTDRAPGPIRPSIRNGTLFDAMSEPEPEPSDTRGYAQPFSAREYAQPVNERDARRGSTKRLSYAPSSDAAVVDTDMAKPRGYSQPVSPRDYALPIVDTEMAEPNGERGYAQPISHREYNHPVELDPPTAQSTTSPPTMARVPSRPTALSRGQSRRGSGYSMLSA